MMPAFSFSAFADATLLYLLDHAVVFGALALCAVLVVARLITIGLDARYDRDELDDAPGHLTPEQERAIYESVRRAYLDNVVSLTDHRKRNGRVS